MSTLAEPVAAREAPDAATLAGRSYAEYAMDVLRDRLIVLDIAPGTPINDEQIGRELGIGRTPVREALKRLEAEHLVTVFPRRGTFAAAVDITDLAAITEIRVQLEPVAAARAARFAAAEARERMMALADVLAGLDSAAVSSLELMRYDLDVHRTIYAASGNRHLESDLVKYDNLATRIWCLVIDRLPDVSGHVAEHVALLRAVADGRADEAAEIARDHITEFETLIRSVI